MDQIASTNYTSARVGVNVSILRAARGMTAAQLAAACRRLDFELDRSAISKIESGSRRVTVDELLVLAKALGYTTDELLAERPVEADQAPQLRDRMIRLVEFKRYLTDKARPGSWLTEAFDMVEPTVRNLTIQVDDHGRVTVITADQSFALPANRTEQD